MGRAIIPILDAALIDAEADAEAAYTLTESDIRHLAAAAGRAAVLVVQASGEVGAASFTLDTLNLSLDGTNYVVIHTPAAPISVTGNGLLYYAAVTLPVLVKPAEFGSAKLKFLATVSALDGSNKITVTAELRLATYSEAA